MNAWLPGLSRKQYKRLMAFFDENPHEWSSHVRSYREVFEKGRAFRTSFWVALCFSWSGIGALIFFINWLNHHEFVTNNRIQGIPNLQLLDKEVKKALKASSAPYVADDEVVQGELTTTGL